MKYNVFFTIPQYHHGQQVISTSVSVDQKDILLHRVPNALSQPVALGVIYLLLLALVVEEVADVRVGAHVLGVVGPEFAVAEGQVTADEVVQEEGVFDGLVGQCDLAETYCWK